MILLKIISLSLLNNQVRPIDTLSPDSERHRHHRRAICYYLANKLNTGKINIQKKRLADSRTAGIIIRVVLEHKL